MPEGALFCDECGLSLLEDAITRQLDIQSDALSPQPGWGTVTLDDDQDILIQVGEVMHKVDVRVEADFVLGRGDDAEDDTGPHLDLDQFGALEKGVSRIHAAFRRGEGVLAIVDLDSTNGTFLNGHRLASHQPHLVRDGDELRLGALSMNIYFRAD